MKHMPISDLADLPKGIQRNRALPDPALGALWESIILDEDIKRRLLSQAVLNFTMRGKVDRIVIQMEKDALRLADAVDAATGRDQAGAA